MLGEVGTHAPCHDRAGAPQHLQRHRGHALREFFEALQPQPEDVRSMAGEGRVLRVRGEYLPILVLTADATRDTRLRALALGARDFISKPFDLLEVRTRIRNMCVQIESRSSWILRQTPLRRVCQSFRSRTSEVSKGRPSSSSMSIRSPLS